MLYSMGKTTTLNIVQFLRKLKLNIVHAQIQEMYNSAG